MNIFKKMQPNYCQEKKKHNYEVISFARLLISSAFQEFIARILTYIFSLSLKKFPNCGHVMNFVLCRELQIFLL